MDACKPTIKTYTPKGEARTMLGLEKGPTGKATYQKFQVESLALP